MRLIDADGIIAWAESSISTVSPCEDQRDAGYLDCLEAVMEIVKEEPVIEAVPLDALCEFLAGYAVAPQYTGATQMIHYTIPNERCWESFLRERFIKNREDDAK